MAAVDVPRVEALLVVAGACSIAVRDAGDTALLEPAPGETPLWPAATVTALFPAEFALERLQSVLAGALPDSAASVISDLADDDWIRAARAAAARPTTIGARLRLLPADHPENSKGLEPLRLGMGPGFGTGRHPTTKLCLEWLARRALEGTRVLDYGCGSGVLALAALKLGADRAYAVDIEPQALAATRDNAKLNSLEDRIWIGRPEDLPQRQVDVALANIIARTLESLAMELALRVRPGGQVVLSGLLEAQVASVQSAYGIAGFTGFGIETEAGWARLVATRVRQ